MTVPPFTHTSSSRPGPARRSSSTPHAIFEILEPDSRDMAEHTKTKMNSDTASRSDPLLAPTISHDATSSISGDSIFMSSSPPTPGGLSRSTSFSDMDDEAPIERLTMFDLLENLALPQKLEKLQNSVLQRANKSQARLRTRSQAAKVKVIEEWRRRVPTADEQLDRYRKRMRSSVDRLNKMWKEDVRSVSLWEKASFIAGVLNIFVTGYLVGAHPELFHYWYTIQLSYFMPIRFFTYRKKGYHYFLADLCYFVNFLTVLSIYVFPMSKRLLISAFCLAFGNNAIAIAMWRNSLVFHSMDKVVSLFIHIMPCLTLHCLVHLLPKDYQAKRYPAIHTILYSEKSDPQHYSLGQMMFWASLPYAAWQLSYHFLISVRRRDKIAAGRPTSFTWLRKSFANVWIGKIVLALPDSLQEPAYMLIQYLYALLTMVPCPLWFWSKWASGIFLTAVFAWSVWNGATFYIDVFGTRFQKELESLKKDVAKWQSVAQTAGTISPGLEPADLDFKGPSLTATAASMSKTAKEPIPELDALNANNISGEQLPGIDGGIETDTVELKPTSKKDQ